MENLLKETLKCLHENGKKESDVLYCCGNTIKFTWENFKELADVEYDDGYGGVEVASNLRIVGKDFWLERYEYDGSEWWEFKEIPKDSFEFKTVHALTLGQTRLINEDYYYACILEEMNNF